jgi:hypothetical protein
MSDKVFNLSVTVVIFFLLIYNGNTTPEILKRTKCQGNKEKKRSGVERNRCFELKNI